MTLPDERYRAVIMAKKFLESIINTRSGLSKDLKDEARSILRHFPSEYDMDRAGEGAPHVFQKRMEPLYRMVKQYDLDKKEKENS
jgi:hypothetical protein